MTWTDASIEAMKLGCDVYEVDGKWQPLVMRYATLPGDWVVQPTADGIVMLPSPYSGAPNACFRLGRIQPPPAGEMPTVALG